MTTLVHRADTDMTANNDQQRSGGLGRRDDDNLQSSGTGGFGRDTDTRGGFGGDDSLRSGGDQSYGRDTDTRGGYGGDDTLRSGGGQSYGRDTGDSYGRGTDTYQSSGTSGGLGRDDTFGDSTTTGGGSTGVSIAIIP